MPRYYIQLDLKASAYIEAADEGEATAELMAFGVNDWRSRGEVYEVKPFVHQIADKPHE